MYIAITVISIDQTITRGPGFKSLSVTCFCVIYVSKAPYANFPVQPISLFHAYQQANKSIQIEN